MDRYPIRSSKRFLVRAMCVWVRSLMELAMGFCWAFWTAQALHWLFLDFEFDRSIKETSNSSIEFDSLRLVEFPESVAIIVAGSRGVWRVYTGVGFFVPSLNFKFGVRLTGSIMVLSTELYSIFYALKIILRSNLSLLSKWHISLQLLAMTEGHEKYI